MVLVGMLLSQAVMLSLRNCAYSLPHGSGRRSFSRIRLAATATSLSSKAKALLQRVGSGSGRSLGGLTTSQMREIFKELDLPSDGNKA